MAREPGLPLYVDVKGELLRLVDVPCIGLFAEAWDSEKARWRFSPVGPVTASWEGHVVSAEAVENRIGPGGMRQPALYLVKGGAAS